MPSIDQIVNVVISLASSAVPRAGFGIPLILGTSTTVLSAGEFAFYSSTTEMLEDGWQTTDPEYIHATRAFAQDLSPQTIMVARRAGGTLAADIAAIQDQAQGNSWYCLILCSKVAADILAAAEYIETQKKIFIAASADSNVPTTATGDVMSQLKDFGYDRTGLFYTEASGNAALGPDAGWAGGQLPQTPGASTWKFKQLDGIDPDDFSSSERTRLIGNPPAGIVGKNANIYETVGGVNITEEGWMASGRFIDVTIGLDWLESEIQANIYDLLVGNPKLPYTDQGAAALQGAVITAIKQGIANGLIDGQTAYSVTVDPVLDVSAANRASRYYPNVSFDCRFSGAFHFVKVTGRVTQ